MIETVCLIYSKGDPKWVQSEPIWDRSPWVETKHGYELLKEKEGPRLISSHLPIQLFPKSFFKSKAKVSVQQSRQSSSGLPWWASGALLFKLCPTLCSAMDSKPPGYSVPGILQARILEWVAMPSSRGSSQARDRSCSSCVSCIANGLFTVEPAGKPQCGDTSSVPGQGSSACRGVQPKNKNIK